MVAPESDPSEPSDPTVSPQRKFNTKLGLVLFAFYLALYLGFVLINAYNAPVMETIVLAGLNLAVVYGFGLIFVALVLALIYGFACRTEPIDDAEYGGSKR